MSKSVVFFIGISAIVTTLIALILIITGYLASGYIEQSVAAYLLNSGLVMMPVSLCFTLGLYMLKRKKPIGTFLVILASAALTVLLLFSAFMVYNVSQNWKLTSIMFILTALIIAPFVWLMLYLWRFRKNMTSIS